VDFPAGDSKTVGKVISSDRPASRLARRTAAGKCRGCGEFDHGVSFSLRRYYSDGKSSKLALVVGGKAVSIGIASDGKHTSIVPLRARRLG
jgi:hypothetical protein